MMYYVFIVVICNSHMLIASLI